MVLTTGYTSNLQGGDHPAFNPLPQSRSDRYPRHGYYNFIWQQTKTANWSKSWMRRATYHILNRVIPGRIDCLRLPPILERPQIILAMIISACMVGLNLLFLTTQS